jgi:HEPN domain-containing protein
MKLEALEWVAKADGDFFDAQRGVRARKNRNPDGVCFHCQQCIEKYLKARLTEAGIRFPKTHDLARLLDLLQPAEPDWAPWRPDLDILTDYAISFRYPAENATLDEARSAFKICKMLRARVREKLALKNDQANRKIKKGKTR